MARRRREDYPGAWHHVTNRGIARRSVFETATDVGGLLDGLEAVRAEGALEVHAYTILTTHFHLLVRSPRGQLSRAMALLQNRYSRAFNRGRRRDGPLFRGRFASRLVESQVYWETVLWYIDRNPVHAALVARSTDYPHGSAWWYARRTGPTWLSRSVVEGFVAGFGPEGAFDPAQYPRLGPADGHEWVHDLAERRLRSRPADRDPFDDLVRLPPAAVQSWMLRKARLADATAPGCVVLPQALVLEALREALTPHDDPGASMRETMEPGLLRTLCGVTLQETADRIGVSSAAVHGRLRRHARRLADDPAYRRVAAAAAAEAFRRFPPATRPAGLIPFRLPALVP